MGQLDQHLPPLPAKLPPLQALANSPFEAAEKAARKQLPFDASYPGLQVVYADPPLLRIDGFMSREMCAALSDAVDASGLLAPSLIGAETLGSDGNITSQQRTSVLFPLS